MLDQEEISRVGASGHGDNTARERDERDDLMLLVEGYLHRLLPVKIPAAPDDRDVIRNTQGSG